MGLWSRPWWVAVVVALLALTLAAPAAAAPVNPATEAATYAKTRERDRLIVSTPPFQAMLRARGIENQADAAAIRATDGPTTPDGREFAGNLCANKQDGCAGDVRLYDWAERGLGVTRPVLFTARNGSTYSGRVWATSDGPARRPGVVITNGSVQAPEELYWVFAQTLAKAGYVVLTWEPQGQGYSDTFGAGVDRSDGVPSQSGRPFVNGTEDALDFFFSGPGAPYRPRPSCDTGTSHADKQDRRVAAGRSTAFNPFHALLDRERVGIAGHSLGAAAVSYAGQADPRVDAVVAWDGLRRPELQTSGPQGQPTFACPRSGPAPRPGSVPIRVPALGMSADYGLTPEPHVEQPGADEKTPASKAHSAAGVDSGELVVRGGTHYEFSFIPNAAFGATARGYDLAAFYTTAWMDRYVRGDAAATSRLATDRWRRDPGTGAADPGGDANAFSAYSRSRLDVAGPGGGRIVCEDLRAGCPGLVADDGAPADYDAVRAASTPDRPGLGPPLGSGSSAPGGAGGPGGAVAVPGQAAPAPQACARRAPAVTFAPRGLRHRRGRLLLSGGARDQGCDRRAIRRVRVAVSRRVGSRCRFLTARGRLSRARACDRLLLLPARVRRTGASTARWSRSRAVRVPRGRYVVHARATDAGGRTSAPRRARYRPRVR